MILAKKLLPLLVVVALIMVIIPACAKPAPGVLKIGVIQPLTGGAAAWGIPVDRGVRLAADDINVAGGIKVGGKTYTLEIISEDTEFSPAVGASAFNKMVFDHEVKYIMGPMSSAIMTAVQEMTEANKVVMIGANASRPKSTDFYTFRGVQIGDQLEIAAYVGVMEIYPQSKTIAVVNKNDEMGRTSQKMVPFIAPSVGLELVANELVEIGTTDFYPLLTKILPLNPDIIDTANTAPGEAGLLIKQAREMGWEGVWLASHGTDLEVVKDIAGIKNMEGMVWSGTGDYIGMAITPEMKDVGERYLARYGTQDAWSLEYYNDILFLKQAIEAADSIDTTKVVETWRTPGFKMVGLYGEVEWVGEEFYGTNSVLSTPMPVTQIKDGIETVTALATWEALEPAIRALIEAEGD